MSGSSDECERTLAFAEIAVGQMKALRQPAYPRNYEVWYAYATGYNPSLNQSINEALIRNGGTLSAADIDQIYDTYLSPARLTDRLDNVGSQIVDEIDRVMGMIDTARGSTSRYGESLAHATQDLGSAQDLDGMLNIVENLVRATRSMEEHNSRLEASLKASKHEISQLQTNLEAVRNESLTDPLTSLANRKYFDTALDKFIAHSVATGEPLALLLADIDHFKVFNDTYGHLTGDQVLRLVAMALKQTVKGQDIAARYGGEEFAIILPNDDTGSSLIERADNALYAAKRYGRNRVMCETDPEAASVSSVKVA
jgi:diguanylate cyclase